MYQLPAHWHAHWKTRTALIEALTVAAGFGSVLLYNAIYNESIPSLLGFAVGVVNATLVGWCIRHGANGSTKVVHGGYFSDALPVGTDERAP